MKKYSLCFLLLCLCYFFLISPPNHLTQWQKIKIKGYLNWVTRPSLLTYYDSLDGPIGLEYDLLKRFCDYHDLKLVVVKAPSNSVLFDVIDDHQVDIAGAHLTKTVQRSQKYMSSEAYDHTSISVVSALSQPVIKPLSALESMNGAILKSSSYEEIADDLTTSGAVIERVADKSLYELLQMVITGEIDYTLADVNVIDIYRAYMPQLRVGLELSEMHELVFLMPYTKKHNNKDDSLKGILDEFIVEYKQQGRIKSYNQFIIESLPNSKVADKVHFLKNYNKRWKNVESMIYTTAQQYDLNPIFLGAISYQESHWNAKAVSPTSVKGLMMLTKAVAKEQGVTDRLDALQSLQGGAQYFIKMKKKIPQRIIDPDRTKFALVAYNIGYRHLEKARVMTQTAGKNPDLWADVKQFLPQLNDLPGRKIDGKTAVRYVENIQVYQNLLQWKQQQ